MDMPIGDGRPASKPEPTLSQVMLTIKIGGAILGALWVIGQVIYHDAVQPAYHYTTSVNTDIHDLKTDIRAVKTDVGLLKSDATTIKETQQRAQEHFQRTDDHFERLDALMTERREGDVYRTRLAERNLRIGKQAVEIGKQAVGIGKQAATTAVIVKKTLDKNERR